MDGREFGGKDRLKNKNQSQKIPASDFQKLFSSTSLWYHRGITNSQERFWAVVGRRGEKLLSTNTSLEPNQ